MKIILILFLLSSIYSSSYSQGFTPSSVSQLESYKLNKIPYGLRVISKRNIDKSRQFLRLEATLDYHDRYVSDIFAIYDAKLSEYRLILTQGNLETLEPIALKKGSSKLLFLSRWKSQFSGEYITIFDENLREKFVFNIGEHVETNFFVENDILVKIEYNSKTNKIFQKKYLTNKCSGLFNSQAII